MSRIAKNSIKIDKEISCSFQNGNFNAKGKLGEMALSVDPLYTVDIQETEIFVNPKSEKDKLTKQKTTIIKDLDSAIHLLRGTYGLAEDPNRSVSRGIRLMKLYNAMTMLTGIAQVVDVARLVMINGIGRTFSISFDLLTSGYAREAYKMQMKSTQLGGESLDMFGSTRAFAMYGIDDAFG